MQLLEEQLSNLVARARVKSFYAKYVLLGHSSGQARWHCNGCIQDFEGSQPDRSECVAQWIKDVGIMVS